MSKYIKWRDVSRYDKSLWWKLTVYLGIRRSPTLLVNKLNLGQSLYDGFRKGKDSIDPLISAHARWCKYRNGTRDD